jgi:hypothetical protein
MTTRGTGIYLRGKTWWLDFTHFGDRHVVRLGKSISRTVAERLLKFSAPEYYAERSELGEPSVETCPSSWLQKSL